MRKRYLQIGTELILISDSSASVDAPAVLGDLEPFRDTSGKMIEGRRQWREHLKETGTIELGHADLQRLKEVHQARKTAFLAKVEPQADFVLGRPVERSRTTARVLERLDGRPAPDRKTLIKMAIEERKRNG